MKTLKAPSLKLFSLLILFTTGTLFSQSLEQKIDALASKEYKANEPGVSILVAKDGKPMYQKAFGNASLELNVPMTTENVFEIGSITKQFTAIAILMLEEQGKLKVSDDMTTYMPDYPTNGKTITIHNLLNHTSGIKSYTSMSSFEKLASEDMTPTELIDKFKNEPMDFEPGEAFRYNNSGYILLGHIIEVVSKMSYEDFVEKNIFEKLAMSNSYYGSNNQIIANRADGYQEGPNGFENSNYLSMTLPYAAGSLMSTTNDLLIWQNALNNHTLISEASYEKAIHGSALNNGEHIKYGYGLFEDEISGSTIIQHGGGIFGYTTMGIYFPEEKVFVSALSNCNCKNVSVLARKIGALVIGKPIPGKEDAIKLTEEQLNAWTGTYEFDGNVLRYVTVENGTIFSERQGSTKLEIYPMSADHFIFDEGSSYKFSKDANGSKQVIMTINGDDIIGKLSDKKAPDEKPSITVATEILETYVGKYELQPGFIIEVTTTNGQLFAQLTGQAQFEMFAEDEDTFYLKVVTASIDFNKDESDSVTSLTLHQNGQDMPANKIE